MKEKVRSIHKDEYCTQPEVIVSSPGRVHLLGEHSWYFGDKTLSIAVNLPVFVAVSKRSDSLFYFSFHQLKEHKKANLSTLKYRKEDRWANFFKAMAYAFSNSGRKICGMDVTVYSDVLPSAGFGITTGMTVAFAIAINKIFNFGLDENSLLKIIESGYRLFLNQPFYRSDVYTALFAKKDCAILTDHSDGSYKYYPFKFPGESIILTDAKVPRISLWEEEDFYSEKNRSMLAKLKKKRNNKIVYEDAASEINEILEGVSEDERRRLNSIIREYFFTSGAEEALEKSSLSNFVRFINKSHEMLADQFQISCPEIDWLVKRILESDAGKTQNFSSCSRIIGKGFGRCTFTLLAESDVENYMQKLIEYERIFGFHPLTYLVDTDDGALIREN
ncbi:MAG: galactokinase [Treponemataceae bacterium]|nr:galactokinase [Treponemataceae bacterium]